jgi:hypothetical protein
MRVNFVEKAGGPDRLVCEAELIFEEEQPLVGMKLVGFSIWRSADSQIFVTFPSRAFGAGQDRRYFDYLRSTGGATEAVRNLKTWIIDQYRESDLARERREDR